jgi:hypothetical protein
MNTRLPLALFAALMLLCPTMAAAQDYAPGEKLTMFNCGRCHKVSEKDRMGGIGSTPSFMTAPFPPDRPPTVHPISLTLKEIDVIVEYARSIEPADLGPDLGLR